MMLKFKFKLSDTTPQRGFTLLEVLAALAVVAIALTALFTALSQGTRLTARVEERMIGNWVASNTMTEFRAFNNWSQTGESNLDVEMAGRVWYVHQEVKPTADENIRRIEITVSLDKRGEDSVSNLYGYMLNPKPKLIEDDEFPLTN